MSTGYEQQVENSFENLVSDGKSLLADWRNGKDLTKEEKEFLECLSAEVLWASDLLNADEEEIESLEEKLTFVNHIKKGKEADATEKIENGIHGLESDISQLTGAIEENGNIDSVLKTLENHLRLMLEGAKEFAEAEEELTSVEYDEELLDISRHAHKVNELILELDKLKNKKSSKQRRENSSLKQKLLDSLGSRELEQEIAEEMSELEPIRSESVEEALASTGSLMKLGGVIESIIKTEERLDGKERKRIQKALKDDSNLKQELEKIESSNELDSLHKDQIERIDRAFKAVEVVEELLKLAYRFDETELKEDSAVEKFEEGRIDYQTFAPIIKSHTKEETRDQRKFRELRGEITEMYKYNSGLEI